MQATSTINICRLQLFITAELVGAKIIDKQTIGLTQEGYKRSNVRKKLAMAVVVNN